MQPHEPEHAAGTASPAIPGEAESLSKTTWAAAIYAVALVALAMLLVVKHVRVAFVQILPMAAMTLLLSATITRLLLRRPVPAWWAPLGGATAGTIGATGTLALIFAVQGRNVAMALSHPDVQHRLLAGPLLGALFAAGLWQMADWQRRERLVWTARLAAQLEGERMSRERLRAELQLLQAQVEPHFLYNTLANLRQLLRTDVDRALEMLEQLIRYFKLALPAFRREKLLLRDELALVECYVRLLKERVDQPLHLSMRVDDSLLGLSVPSGAVLCLVENAIKHGRPEDRSAPCEIQIQAIRSDAVLSLSVEDNGPGLGTARTSSASSTGIGLLNLHERLRLLYPEDASLRLSSGEGQGCKATLRLPCEETWAH